MFVLYKSSAGSGKTFTLVKEYLKLCLVEPQIYSAILAITFTNKAAAEMKTRIIDSLHRFLDSGADDIIDLVIAETGITREKAVAHCGILLDNILHAYSDFSVMTIDSFIARIVRTFTYDLEMPMKFDVELDMPAVTVDIVERLLAVARADNFAGTILTDFAISKIFSTGSWAIDTELYKIGAITFNEKHADPVGKLASARYNEIFWKDLIDTVARQCAMFKNHINALARRGLDIIAAHGLTVENFSYGTSGAAGALAHYATATAPDEFRIRQRLANSEWIAKKTPPEIVRKINSAVQSGLGEIAEEIVEYIPRYRERYTSYYLVRKNIYTEALITQFIRLTEAYKTEKQIVPLYDFSKKVAAVVKSEPVPFLYWRLGTQYRHIMIDEFQDTSQLQWLNLKPLIEESLAYGHFNMAVGDGKQAIYRWRAGEVKILEEQLPAQLGGQMDQKHLDRNFRSRVEIVEFNNQFFCAVPGRFEGMGDSLFAKLYAEKSVQQRPVSEDTGYVKVCVVPADEAAHKAEQQEEVLEKVHADIRAILEEGNGYSLRDIAILVRSNREAASTAHYLSGKEIEVISPDSLFLENASVVRFVISALRYIASEDKIALLNMWLFRGRKVKEFERKRKSQSDVSAIAESLSPELAEGKHRIYQLPVYEAIEEIIRLFGLQHTYCGFLQGLLEVALQYSEKLSGDIHRFLEWWDEGTNATLSSVERSDAVIISTIHKAKGLEYPIVLIPFGWDIVDRAGFGKSNFIWVQDDNFGSGFEEFPFIVDMQSDLQESWFREQYRDERERSRIDNLNLLYVAFTRAIDRLYLYLREDESESDVSGEPKTTGELIGRVIDEMPLQSAVDGWSLGCESKKSLARDEIETTSLDSLPTYQWRNKITMKRSAAERWPLDDTEFAEKTETGILIHDILAGIETESDVDNAIEGHYREGMIGLKEKTEYYTLLTEIMDIEYSKGKVGDWFDPGWKVMNERTITSADRESRPDRVIVGEERTIVIDYKTGRKAPEHALQITRYGDLLREMGYKNIEKYLLYLESREVVEV